MKFVNLFYGEMLDFKMDKTFPYTELLKKLEICGKIDILVLDLYINKKKVFYNTELPKFYRFQTEFLHTLLLLVFVQFKQN